MAKEIERRIARLAQVIARAKDRALILAINQLEADFKTRIFTEGRKPSGAAIGSYSTKETYVSIAGAQAKYGSQIKTSALTPKGKNGSGKFKNGNTKKSQYFDDGYAGFRAQVGRQTSKVDLNLTGNLQNQIVSGTSENGVALGYLDSGSEQLAKNLEAKYGEVFTPSDDEVEAIFDILQDEIFNAIEQAL
jgi:hypothetical protein